MGEGARKTAYVPILEDLEGQNNVLDFTFYILSSAWLLRMEYYIMT